jgi:fermentation-respiration switch protein FrsA (DUF1100 family)
MKHHLVIPAVLALLLPACTTMAVGERALLHPTPAAALTGQAAAAAGYRPEPQSVRTADGVTLDGVLLRRPGARLTILYFGGNLFRSGVQGPAVLRALAPFGANVMLVDHRGYGQSGGSPSFDTVETDGLAAFDHLVSLPGIDAGAVVVHGQSLGSFVAGEVAAKRATAGVILESSATTAEEWAAARVPLAAKPFVRIRLEEKLKGRGNLSRMRDIEEPLLLLVGAQDRTTPPRLSERLYAASTSPSSRKTLVVVPGAGHNDVLAHSSAAEAYGAFLRRVARP